MSPRLLACGFIIFSLAENSNLTLVLYTVPTQEYEFGISRAQLTGAALNPLPATAGVFSQGYTLGFPSAHCHDCHACLLLIFCVSFKMLVTEFFPQMPCAMSSNILTCDFTLLAVPDWQRGLHLCAGHLTSGSKGKSTSIICAFSSGRAKLELDVWLVAGMKAKGMWSLHQKGCVHFLVDKYSQWELAKYFLEWSFLCLFFC